MKMHDDSDPITLCHVTEPWTPAMLCLKQSAGWLQDNLEYFLWWKSQNIEMAINCPEIATSAYCLFPCECNLSNTYLILASMVPTGKQFAQVMG